MTNRIEQRRSKGEKLMRSRFVGSGRSTTRRAAGIIIAMVVMLAVLTLTAACGSSGGDNTTTTTATPGTTGGGGGAQVVMKSMAFDPASVTIKAGESVTWTNQDSATHTVVGDDDEFQSGDLANGASFSFTFDKAGTYTYHCGIHPSMKGTVVVQ